MLLKEFLEPLVISQPKLARHLGWMYARPNEIVHGKRGITAESALTLSDAFAIEPEFWMNQQRDWDLWHKLKDHVTLEPVKDVA